jgi:peptidyl-prolyl cis-trans isomerase SurA
MLRNKMVQALLLCWLGLAAVQAADKTSGQEIDRIVVVVNDDVITRHELDERLDTVKQQLKKQGTSLPAAAELEKQVLERMIMELLQLQYAKETGVRVDDVQLDKALGRIAQQNNFASLAEFRAKLVKDGVDFKKFREEIRSEIISSRLREREVDSKMVVSDSEIENYLLTQSKQAGKGEELELAHILLLVPEQASADKIQSIKRRAEQAQAQLRSGSKFAQVAAGFSDAQDALQGGNLGWRPADRIPALFLDALQQMKPGEISPILRSPNAFHILKLLNRRSTDVPVVITQTHARHILIKTSELVSESEAKSRLAEIKTRIEGGASFADQAKLYSEDGSAAQGGDLGWASPGTFVPEFEKAMNALQPGEMSGLVQTDFGWHLIQVLERRNADVTAEQKRQRAVMAIRAFKSDEAYQDWLRQLRDRAFVEYRN